MYGSMSSQAPHMPSRSPRIATRPARTAALAAWALFALASCGGDSPNEPTPQPQPQSPTVSAVAPASGTTLGGTTVTVTGTNFAAGATVTIGGAAATDVAVSGATSLTARTPQHASGPGDVVVTVAGRSGTLPNGFRFDAPPAADNRPPTIGGITSRSSRANAPSAFADLDDTLTVTATVSDAETPADQLRYEWTADAGAFAGSGREVTWRAPAQATTPAVVRLSLTVIETYQTVNSQGLPVSAEHRVPATFDVRLHASAKEVRDMSVEFLIDFSQQRLSPEQVVRNFSDSCRGKFAELDEVRNNQNVYTITAYNVEGNPPVEVAFAGVCRERGRTGDACSYVNVRWDSTEKANGKRSVTIGVDQVNAIYENSRWRLCDSDFFGTQTINGLRIPPSAGSARGQGPGARARAKAQGRASMQYIRHDRFFVLIATKGNHEFFLEEAIGEFEKKFIQSALRKTEGNQSKAAKILGVHRNTLCRKIVQHNLNGR
jgi:hypothetical protein